MQSGLEIYGSLKRGLVLNARSESNGTPQGTEPEIAPALCVVTSGGVEC